MPENVAVRRRVFISYSSQDKAMADGVCGAVEKSGIPCWIAPRDIEAGTDFPSEILRGISETDALVVLLTAHAVASPHVLSEINHAFSEKKRILPVRFSSEPLPDDFAYFLSTPQWFDASDGLAGEVLTDAAQTRLVGAVKDLLAGRSRRGIIRRGNRKVLAGSAAAFVGLAIAAGFYFYPRQAPLVPKVDPKVTPNLTAKNDATVAHPGPVDSNTAQPLPTPPVHKEEAAKLKIRLNPKDGLKYVWVPPGAFTMGCSAADNECRDDEKPAHRVTIPAGFWLGQIEATNAAYRKVMQSKAADTTSDPALPVIALSWPEARAFCAATGGRLPTEAEWEYAARAGAAEPYYGVPGQIAWYVHNSGHAPHRGGLKAPNAFGLYDMLGNASEWVLDRYYNKYDLEADAVGAHIDLPLTGNSSAVARGGYWDSELSGIRVSHRAEMLPDQEGPVSVRCASDRL